MNSKTLISIVVMLAIIFSFVSCGNNDISTDQPEGSTPQDSAIESDESDQPQNVSEPEQDPANDSYYPVEITTYDYSDQPVVTTYEKAPEKVIAVYQGSIETMIALGLEDHVVASYGLDNEVKEEWKDGFSKINYDDSTFAPDKETVVMLEPDMIFSWGSLFGEKALGDVHSWIESGVNTYMNSNTRRTDDPIRTLENEYTDILNIGKIFNVETKAQEIVDEMKNEISAVVEANKAKEGQTVMIIEFDDAVRNYGANSLGGDMVTQLGGTLSEQESKSMGKEDVISNNPDVIFVVYMAYSGENGEDVKQTNLDKLLIDEAFANLDAFKNGQVYPIMLGDMYASAVRTIDGIKTISEGLYTE